MTNERDILKDLLVDESELIQNLTSTIQKVKDIFVLEKNSGKIIFKNYPKLTNPQRIACVLIGKYFAKRLRLIVDDTLTISQISSELEIPQTTLSSPLKSLRKLGYVLYSESHYKINPHRIEEIVVSILSSKIKK